jgi:hypothetical protein
MKLSRSDIAAIILSLLALAAVYFLTVNVFEGVPHIEDETAYSWQASVFSGGNLTLSSPPCPKCFLVPFVVDYDGQRFGKYPPGWPVVLSFGVKFGIRDWINPILAALCVWLTYRLGKKLLNEVGGLIAATLTLTSPFFLMNGGTLLSHIWSLFLTVAFILAWIDLSTSPTQIPSWMLIWTAGLSLGVLALTRPLTAVAIGLPFFIDGLIRLVRGPKKIRQRNLSVGVVAIGVAGLLFIWQYALTGDPFLNPYTLWWPYDRIGFGPNVGVQEGGHSLLWARSNTRFSLKAGSSDLFGWGKFSWLFAPFGIIALRKIKHAWAVLAVAPSLVLFYMLYWIGSWVYGPRYYFEGLVSLTIASAAGIQWLAGSILHKPVSFKYVSSRVRFGLVAAFTTGLIAASVLYYSPIRIGSMHGLYGVTRIQLTPFQSASAEKLAPALIIVHRLEDWREYGTLLEISSPYFETPFVFTYDRGLEMNQDVIQYFSDRSVFHYYADQPNTFYTNPRQ